MWNGKKKAVTFSFDDGVTQDIRTIEILNKYGLKATFNLNSGLLGLGGEAKWIDGIVVPHNKVGMEKHLEDLTATGHIGAFVGMLTDSRSLLSYPRHHYFRRILCTWLAEQNEKGDWDLPFGVLQEIAVNLSYQNAKKKLKK